MMSMGKEEFLSIHQQSGIFGHDREVQQQLVNLRIAVSLNGDDFCRVLVKDIRHIGRGIVRPQWISWAMVQQIPKEDDLLGLKFFQMTFQFKKCFWRTVYV